MHTTKKYTLQKVKSFLCGKKNKLKAAIGKIQGIYIERTSARKHSYSNRTSKESMT